MPKALKEPKEEKSKKSVGRPKKETEIYDIEHKGDIKIFEVNSLFPHSDKDGGYWSPRILQIGASNSGKTTGLKNIVFFMQSIFKKIFVFSGSEAANGWYERFVPRAFIFNEFDEDMVTQ